MARVETGARSLDVTPTLDHNFRRGHWVTNIAAPLKYSLRRHVSVDTGPLLPAYFLGSVPLFSEAFIAALDVAGVDNFQRFAATVYDPDSGQSHTQYQAVNILGLIAAADMDKSIATVYAGGPLLDTDFDSLVINDAAAQDIGLFRLAESSNAILIRADVVASLHSQGFAGTTQFYDPATCAL